MSSRLQKLRFQLLCVTHFLEDTPTVNYKLEGEVSRLDKSTSVDAVQENRGFWFEVFVDGNGWQQTRADQRLSAVLTFRSADYRPANCPTNVKNGVLVTDCWLNVELQSVSNTVSCRVCIALCLVLDRISVFNFVEGDLGELQQRHSSDLGTSLVDHNDELTTIYTERYYNTQWYGLR